VNGTTPVPLPIRDLANIIRTRLRAHSVLRGQQPSIMLSVYRVTGCAAYRFFNSLYPQELLSGVSLDGVRV
jgi:hypothetical protein